MFSKITKVLLGVLFFVFGANGLAMIFLGKGFLPVPPPETDAMKTFFAGLMAAGYLMPLVKTLEVVAGLLLILNRYVNLALVLLAPIVVNILLIHVFAAPSGMPIAIVVTILWFGVFLGRFQQFKSFLLK